MRKLLPIGIQDFKGLIEGGYKYIDKTAYLYKLATEGKYYFLSRPRRFGKSLTLSTLKALFEGNRSLFNGLWIEDRWNWTRTHPVIHWSFKDINYHGLGLEAGLYKRIMEIAQENNLPINEHNARDAFRSLVKKLSTLQNPVVLLIDEYDAPIVHYLGKDTQKASDNRDDLKEFYSIIKELESYLAFVFITGVSKFSKVGIFSGLNNLQDISMSLAYAPMLGYTQDELKNAFHSNFSIVAEETGMDTESVINDTKKWYNGYRFHEQAESVYNPLSCHLLFQEKSFRNYWFETGTPTFLINILKQEGLYDFSITPQSEHSFSSFELDNINPYGLLYQTGYLTILRKDEFGLYHLGYPNLEVENSMLEYLLEAFGGVKHGSGQFLAIQMEQAFYKNDLDSVFRILQGLFKSVPYHLFNHQPESFYHAVLHILFSYMGIRINSEVCTSDGRADAIVETDRHVYILEFKLDQTPDSALHQIRTKKYYQSFWNQSKPVIGVGVCFSKISRTIESWKAEAIPAVR